MNKNFTFAYFRKKFLICSSWSAEGKKKKKAMDKGAKMVDLEFYSSFQLCNVT